MALEHASFFDRFFPGIAALLLLALGCAQIGSAIQENPTNDEPIHLTAGYVYLTTGDYHMDPSHPPLARVLAALPLLMLPLKRIPAERAWPEFLTTLWGNQIPASHILLSGRLVVIALTLLLGVRIAWWTRRRFGARAALLALTFFCFDPNIIAHGHYITTDMAATLGIFLACTLWCDFLDQPNWTRMALAGLGLGIALVSKYSALFLLLVFPLLYCFQWGFQWRRRRGHPFHTWRDALSAALVVSAVAGFVVALTYAPETAAFFRSAPSSLQSFGYFRGLEELAKRNSGGWPTYLFGHIRQFGFWEYFPAAFLLKTPSGVLLGCGIAVIGLVRSRRRLPPALLSAYLALPPVIFFAMAMGSRVDMGIRHILPIYPFLYVALAYVLIEYGPDLLRGAWLYTIAGLVVLVLAESISAYPHYLPFFNWACGGPVYGPRYLLDSNVDWGQDIQNLAGFVHERKMSPLCTALFGPVPLDYYGIYSRDLNQTGVPEGVDQLPCTVAVSVNFLHGLYIPSVVYGPLLRRRPAARIGYSIYVYDLRR